MKILFCGSRDWNDKETIYRVMSLLQVNLGDFIVIQGEARGADKIAKETAKFRLLLPTENYTAEWYKYGYRAGPIRNRRMLEEGKPDGVVAFHNNISESKGTKNMVEIAVKANLPTWVSSESMDKLGEFILLLKKVSH